VSVGDVATLVAAVIAVAGFLGPVRAYYNRTVGRRFDLYRRFERLGVGAHQSFFETVIGEAPAIRRSITRDLPDYSALPDDESEPPLVEHVFTEALWVDPLFYAQTVADTDGTVLGFSITTRKRRFAPRFAVPRPVPTLSWLLWRLTRGRHQLAALAHVQLGQTKLADVVLTDWGVPGVRCVIGARTYAYSEAWYFGNPGYYSHYVCTASTVSQVGGYPENLQHIDWPENRDDPNEGYAPTGEDEEPVLAPWIEAVRNNAVVTTWSVIQFPLSPEYWPPENFGPHGDEVRTLP
jgi:hypothetical protein